MFKSMCIITTSVVLVSFMFIMWQSKEFDISIKNPFEAFSSIAYGYIYYGVKNMHTFVPMMCLAIASFVLWSNVSILGAIWDVTCMYWAILTTAVSILPISYSLSKKYQIFINSSFLLYLLTLSLLYVFESIHILENKFTADDTLDTILGYYHINLETIIGSELFSSFIMTFPFHYNSKTYMLGGFWIILGFVSKILYLNNILAYGTGLFHLFTAYGIYVLSKLCISPPSDDEILDEDVNEFSPI